MRNFVLKTFLIFFIVVGVTYLMLSYLFYNSSTSRGSRAAVETMAFSFVPAVASLDTDGQEVTTTIKVKPSAVMATRGYYFRLTFDKTKVQVKDIVYKLGAVSAGLGQTNADLAKINTNGWIIIQGEDSTVAGTAFASTTTLDVATIKIARKAAGGNDLIIDKDNVFFYKKVVESNSLVIIKGTADAIFPVNGGVIPTSYKCNCTAAFGTCGNFGGKTNIRYRECTSNTSGTFNCMLFAGRYYNYASCSTPTPTVNPNVPTVTPGGPTPTAIAGMINAKLVMNLKLQGIGAKPATTALSTIAVRVKLYDETTSVATAYQTGAFVANASGVWTGEVTFYNINPNHKYAVLVKGPLHLSKRVCVVTPTETQGGTYRCSAGLITLVSGNNNLNLSGILMLGGDLPVADQDGSVTAIDTSFIRNNLKTEDATLKSKCDINRDDRCDTQDYSLVIGSLSIKNDEE